MGIGAVSALALGSSVGQGVAGVVAADKAAEVSAANNAANIALARETQKRNLALAQPYINAGQTGLNALQNQNFYQTPTDEQIRAYLDPSMKFRQEIGQNAVNANAANAGLFFSGATGQALQNYGQQLASTEYSNAFDRYLKSLQTAYSNANNTANVGVNGLAAATGANTNANTAITNANNANSVNQQSAALGTANAIGGALGGAANAGQQYLTNSMIENYLQNGVPQNNAGNISQGTSLGGGAGYGNNPYLQGTNYSGIAP